ncbi:MAG: alanine racemase [Actinobacteria bacterium HGW-Actinobacteria-7]|jgi:alanine racemase|nr:MAG: alanine racemase [Actinobacteria bacterium HGW-Actinobacteria-7]
MTEKRWVWSEIDLGAIAHNVKTLKGRTVPGTLFMAVVKADGYGHGAVRVARAALAAGADRLGVATVDEAIELRDAGITSPIQLLSEPPDSVADIVLAHGIVPAVTTREFAGALGRAAVTRGIDARYHLKIDTGMNRIGVPAEDAPKFAAMLSEFPGLSLEGTFTHFATADVPGDWDVARQLKRFNDALAGMRSERVDPGIVHAANSPATILVPEAHFDMVRCGIAIYGLHPAPSTYEEIDLKPALAVKARATLVKRIGIGEGVSYGLTWQAGAQTTIATLPLGYADGVHRALSGRMQVLLAGRRCSQVGRICMDQLMIEIPRGVEASRGDEFVLVGAQGGERIALDELAELAGTINYELSCSLGRRIARRYIEGSDY